MGGLLQNELRASKFLLDTDSIRRTLFELAERQGKVPGGKSALWSLERTARALGMSPEDVRSIQVLRNRLAHNRSPTSEQLLRVSQLLERAREILKEALHTPTEVKADFSLGDRDRFLAAADFVTSHLGQKASRDRATHIREVETLIFESPGHFILDLCQRLNRPLPRPGFSYSSVWLYVQKLVRDGKVLTVGGPKGVNRYCFPHPNHVESWEAYYGRLFAVEARLERKLTERIDFSYSRKLVDVYEANSVLRKSILIVADMGRLDPASGGLVRSYGTLQPFNHLKSDLGLEPMRGMPKLDVLIARGVDRVMRDGREERVWPSPSSPVATPSLA